MLLFSYSFSLIRFKVFFRSSWVTVCCGQPIFKPCSGLGFGIMWKWTWGTTWIDSQSVTEIDTDLTLCLFYLVSHWAIVLSWCVGLQCSLNDFVRISSYLKQVVLTFIKSTSYSDLSRERENVRKVLVRHLVEELGVVCTRTFSCYAFL